VIEISKEESEEFEREPRDAWKHSVELLDGRND
jgi:hypothetical protein